MPAARENVHDVFFGRVWPEVKRGARYPSWQGPKTSLGRLLEAAKVFRQLWRDAHD